jgi:multimeric flavodoxin WrbA
MSIGKAHPPGDGSSKHRPTVVALVGSPRRRGNTVAAVEVAKEELARRGVDCEVVMLCDLVVGLLTDDEAQMGQSVDDPVEELLDRVWAAEGLIFATPIHFCTVSAQMKAFMDRTNDRYMKEEWLAPRAIGLLVVGAQGGFTSTIEALRRYLDLMAPSRPPLEVAAGHADAIGETQRSQEVRQAARAMAERMADALLAGVQGAD